MARRNRITLKNYFKQGNRPGEQAFEDLIDSTLNTLDDGFSGSAQIGIGLAPMNEKGVIITAFRNSADTIPAWEIALDKKGSDFEIRRCDNEEAIPLLTLKYHPENKLEMPEIQINGIINAKGRKGNFKTGQVPADGIWHNIINEEDRLEPGCWAFEVVAGCGERHNGRYALAVSTAIQCFGGKARIHTVQSHFGQWGNKIKLRWVKNKHNYGVCLQIKTRLRYSEEVQIQYQISNLWDNPLMKL